MGGSKVGGGDLLVVFAVHDVKFELARHALGQADDFGTETFMYCRFVTNVLQGGSLERS